MTPLSSFLSSSFSLILLLSNLRGTTAAGRNLIHDTCRICSRDNPNIKFGFCTTSLQAAPASRCATLRGLGSISIRLTRYNVTDTRCHIKHLLEKKKKLDPYVKGCLNDCFELYSNAIPAAKQAMKYYNSKRYVDANVQISAVMDATTTCEEGFVERGLVSPLTNRNKVVFELSAIVLSIMHIIQSGSN